MARVAGIDLLPHKPVSAALTRLYGVGRNNAKILLDRCQIPHHIRCKDLTEAQISTINSVIAKDCKVEGELRREIDANIRHYIEIGSFKGQRHRKNLPVNGQRTRTNARTRRGMRRTVGSAKPGIVAGKPAAAPAASAAKPAK
ncbi:MAG: 30S ribosomal protein S13 [Elusimicrobiota bacterium]